MIFQSSRVTVGSAPYGQSPTASPHMRGRVNPELKIRMKYRKRKNTLKKNIWKMFCKKSRKRLDKKSGKENFAIFF
jgi:hypothetical protein